MKVASKRKRPAAKKPSNQRKRTNTPRITKEEVMKRAAAVAKTVPGAKLRNTAYNVTVLSKAGKHIAAWTGSPKKGWSRANPETETAADRAAAEMFEKFHGRPPKKIIEYETDEEDTVSLAECGRLIELTVTLDDEWAAPIQAQGHIQVCTTADGGQLYFIGGRQQIDLDDLGVSDQLPKDQIVIGECTTIVYHTVKGFHDFEPTDYTHDFGEEGGRLPVLNYDTRSNRLFLTGGSYQVKPEGIVD